MSGRVCHPCDIRSGCAQQGRRSMDHAPYGPACNRATWSHHTKLENSRDEPHRRRHPRGLVEGWSVFGRRAAGSPEC